MNILKKIQKKYVNQKMFDVEKTTIKFFILTLMACTICLTSCTKEGPQGPIGLSGTDGIDGGDGTNGTNGNDGTNGTNGTNGEDGVDGNANITSATYDLSNISGTSFTLSTNKLTPEIVEDGVVLAYIKAGTEWYPIPNQRVFTNGFSIIDISSRFAPFGLFYSYNLVFHRDGAPVAISAGDLDELRLVFIPDSSSTSGKSSGSSILNTFYEEGIDPSDYYQVMQYFGLK